MKGFFQKIGVIAGALLGTAFSASGQDSSSLSRLTPEAFATIVRTYHPVVQQAAIGVAMAQSSLTAARGGFDPAFYLNSEQKTFNGTQYYQYTNPELKIPTWYGIEVKTGLESNGGAFLNSESSIGKTSYLGVSVPLAKNLLMDKRRAVLQQAKIYSKQATAEQALMINDILQESYEAYWNWAKSWQQWQVWEQAVALNADRLSLVRIGWRQGDRPAIDTVEALAQLQQFQMSASEARLQWLQAGIELSQYLWLPDGSSYQLPETVQPDPSWMKQFVAEGSVPNLNELLELSRTSHPALRIYDFKLQVLEVERKLKFQSLLPTINLKANLLNKGYEVWKGVGAGFFENNNKFGIELGLPLRLSEGRGNYRAAKLKIQDTRYNYSLKQVSVTNKIRTYHASVTTLSQQIRLIEQAVQNYQTLFRGEDIRFKNGESSLFLLNSRENKVLEATQKLIELRAKYFKTQIALLGAAGLLK